MGEVLDEKGYYTHCEFINLTKYHKVIDLIGNSTFQYTEHCSTSAFRNYKFCSIQKLNELNGYHMDLKNRLNFVYEFLDEKESKRRKRSLVGRIFGRNKSKAKKQSNELRNYMNARFKNIESLEADRQNKIEVLESTQNRLKMTLSMNEKKIEAINEQIKDLTLISNTLKFNINENKLYSTYNRLKIDVLNTLVMVKELQQWLIDLTKNIINPQLVTPEKVTDEMMNLNLKEGRFLADPTLKNYYDISETISTSAFLIKDIDTIMINFMIPRRNHRTFRSD